MSEPGENAIRIDWRLEEGEEGEKEEEKRMGERRFGEGRRGEGNIKAVSEFGLGPRLGAKIQWNTDQNLPGVGCLGEQCAPQDWELLEQKASGQF